MRIVNMSTRDGYDRWSELYDDSDNALVALEDTVLSPHLRDVHGKRALDVGCGTGRHTFALLAAGAEVTAIDFSDGMLEKARAKPGAERVRFLVHDLTHPLPFDDDAFDVVICSLVLEHLPDLVSAFRQMRRICCPGGWIHVADLHPAMQLRDARAQFSDHAAGEDVRVAGFEHSISDFVLAIRDAGLTLETMQEHVGTQELIANSSKMERFVGWPMLLTFRLRPSDCAGRGDDG